MIQAGISSAADSGNTFIVTYDANGGTSAPDTQTYTGSEDVYVFTVSATSPVWQDHVFLGWSDDPVSTEPKYTSGSSVSLDEPGTVNLYAVWYQYSYELDFDANGGSGAPSPLSRLGSSDAYAFTIPDTVPSRESYVFVGWSKSGDESATVYAPGSTVSVACNSTVILYAVWTQNTIVLSYDANGGTDAPPTQTYAGSSDEYTFAITYSKPTREYYVFSGWALSAGGTTAYSPGSDITIGADSVLYAVWTQYTYTLAYDSNGGTALSYSESYQDNTASHKFTVSDIAPVRDNYLFAGWSTVKTDTSATYQAGELISVASGEKRTLYAVWSQNQMKLTYDSNGGTGSPATQAWNGSTDSHQFTVTSEVLTRTNYIFAGWSETKGASSAEYHAGSLVSVSSGSTKTLYAVWTQNTIILSYDANGGTGAPSSQSYIGSADENTFTVTVVKPSRDQFVFAGWSTSASGSAEYNPGSQLTAGRDIVLYAVWIQHHYSLKYDSNGGLDLSYIEYWYGNDQSHAFTVSGVTPVRDNYIFAGWSASKTSSIASYQVGDEVAVGFNENRVIYAVWTQNKMALVYDSNGGTGTPQTQTWNGSTSTHAFTVTSDVPTRSEYIFAGWSTAKDSGTADYHGGASIEVQSGSTVTVYAVWAQGSYHLTYDCNGSSTVIFDVIAYGSDSTRGFIVTSVEPVRSDYVFDGWSVYLDAPATLHKGDTVQIGINTTVTLYAIWKQNTYTLGFDDNGGQGGPLSIVNYGSSTSKSITVPDTVPARDHYIFSCWRIDQSAESYSPGSTVTVAANTSVCLKAEWRQVHIVLNFDSDGGSGSPNSLELYDSVQQTLFTIPDTRPVRDGYNFVGWSNDQGSATADYQPGNSVTVEAPSLTLYAVWSTNTFELVYYSQDGMMFSTEDSTGPENSQSFSITYLTPSREHYVFIGWSGTSGGSAEYCAGSVISIAANATKNLYAVWYQYTYTVSYDPNGGTSAPGTENAYDSTSSHSFAVSDAVPVRESYEFLGWSVSPSSSTSEYVSGDLLTVNSDSVRTLYAVWAQYTFTLNFDLNGGNGAVPGQTAVGAEETHDFTVPSETPSRDNYNFGGWILNSSGGNAYHYGDTVTVNRDEIVTLHAAWIQNTITLTYVTQGGSMSETEQIYQGSELTHEFTIMLESPVLEHYLFAGWSDTVSGAATYHAGDSITVTADAKVLYAIWFQNSYSIYFDANGGTSKPETQTYLDSETSHTFILTDTVPFRENYVFLGWSASSTSTAPEYVAGDECTVFIKNDVTLYAVWYQYSLEVRFDANGGTGGPTALSHLGSVTEYTFVIPDAVPALDNYVFVGWNTPSGDGTIYTPGDYFKASSSVTSLLAVWKQYTYGIDYNANGGSSAPDSQGHSGSETVHAFILSGESLTRDHYIFLGWSTAKDSDTADYAPGSNCDVAADSIVTLYAVWHQYSFILNIISGDSTYTDRIVKMDSCDSLVIDIPVEIPQRDESIFVGWSFNRQPDEPWYVPDPITATSVTVPKDSQVTVYALWGTKCGEDIYFKFEDSGTFELVGSGTMWNYNAGETPWYQIRGCITDIIIGTGIVSIGDHAFAGTDHLLRHPDLSNITYIGDYSFEGSSFADEVVLTQSVSHIGCGAFKDCANITSLQLLACSAVPEQLCSGCTSLQSVTLSSGLKSVGSQAFNSCSGLTELELPEDIESIGEGSFKDCSGLTAVDLGKCARIGEYAFSGCTGIKNAAMSATLVFGSPTTFSGCSSIEKVTLTGSGPTADFDSGNYTNSPWYISRDSLVSVSMDPAITKIGDYYFAGQSTITPSDISTNAASYGGHAFSGCTGIILLTIPSSVVSVGESCFNGCWNISELVIASHGVELAANSFTDCFAITSMQVVAGYRFTDGVFSENLPLEKVSFFGSGAVPSYTSDEHAVLPWCGSSRPIEFTVGYGITEIGSYVFAGISGECTFDLPETLTAIGSFAFFGCTGMKSLILPNSLTSLGESAVRECPSLESLSMPAALIFGDGAFYGCGSVKEVFITGNGPCADYSVEYGKANCCHGTPWYLYGLDSANIHIGDGVTDIGSNMFRYCSSLTSLVQGASVGKYGESAFGGCSFQSLTVPDNVLLGGYVFRDCFGLVSITVPDNSVFDASNFDGCSSLSEITVYHSNKDVLDSDASGTSNGNYLAGNSISLKIDDGVVSILDHMFEGCVSLTEVSISASVGRIGIGAFDDCSEIVKLSVPATVALNTQFVGCTGITEIELTGIGEMFNYSGENYSKTPWQQSRESLASITYGDGLTSIGSYAFYGMAFASTVIPSGIYHVREYAFADSQKLTSVIIGSGLESFNPLAVSGCPNLRFYVVSSDNTFLKSSNNALYSKDLGTLISCPPGLDGTFVIGEDTVAVSTYAFNGCSIASLVIDSPLIVFGDSSVIGCGNLICITVPAGLKADSNQIQCNTLTKIVVTARGTMQDYGTNAADSDYYRNTVWYGSHGIIADIVIEDGVQHIGANAFKDCTEVGSLSIPNSVSTIGKGAFIGVPSLKVLSLPATLNSSGCFDEGLELDRLNLTGTSMIDYSADPESDMYYADTVWNTAGCIGSIVLSDDITNIGANAFRSSTLFDRFVLPSKITSISDSAFRECTMLSEIDFPASLAEVYDNAFCGCTSLNKMIFEGQIPGVLGTSSLYVGYGSKSAVVCTVISDRDLTQEQAVVSGLSDHIHYTMPEYEKYQQDLRKIELLSWAAPIAALCAILSIFAVTLVVKKVVVSRNLK